MLRLFGQRGRDFVMTFEEAGRWDQRSLRSMLVRGWVSYWPNKGIYLTKEGEEAWEEFRGTDIHRRNPKAPLTSYLDLGNYGLNNKARGAA
jgi:hypothetical protein